MMYVDKPVNYTKWTSCLLLCAFFIVQTALLTSCSIENDIPYPTLEGTISAITVEGQCDSDGNSTTSATISKTAYTAQLYVDDTVDLTALTITRLSVTNDAQIIPNDATQCVDADNFPTTGFSSLDSLSSTADTRMDFTNPVSLTLRTYQDYVWTLTAERVLIQDIELQRQVGSAVIDNDACTVTIYVSSRQSLSAITVTTFNLGGPHGTVSPDPTGQSYDFSSPQTFDVTFAWETTSHTYTVTVLQTDDEEDTSAEAFPWATRAYFNGSITVGDEPEMQYKESTSSTWITVDEITVSGTTYSAVVYGLTPGTTYDYRTNVEGTTGTTLSFTTAPATELTDGDFDDWHIDTESQERWEPWAEGGTQFWDTGNRGSLTLGVNLSTPDEDTCDGEEGYSAKLESRYMILRFGSASIFTGTYDETTGTNAVLSFGREFSSFPTKMRINYKYTPETIKYIGDDDCEFLRGQPDSCWIYIALTDWDEPYTIRTRKSERQLFDVNDEHVIAFAQIIKGEEVPDWTTVDLELEYRYTDRTPTYILVVAAASKYGDYFCGGDGSLMYVDNFELIYE